VVRRHGWSRSLIVALLVCAPAIAGAKGNKGKAAPPKPAPAPREPTDAERLSKWAEDRYREGDYAQAIGLYKRAHDLTPIATILFNIAHIYDKKLNERVLAEEYYRRFLAAPDAPPEYVEKANVRLAALKKAAEEAAKQPPPEPPKPAPEPPKPAPVVAQPAPSPTDDGGRRRAMRVAGVVVAALGVAAIAGGSAAGLIAMDDNNRAAALCNGPACSDGRALTLTSDAFAAANASTALFIGGAVALVAGVLVFALAPKPRAVAIAPSLAPSMAGLTLAGTFR
jgi:tetratricopeptide (TPR) repeat protein